MLAVHNVPYVAAAATLAVSRVTDRQIIRGQLAVPGRLTGPYVASSGREATILRH